MRLTCPNCDAQYEVADTVIPDDGRDVQCSNCGTTWFQEPASALAAAARRADDSDVAQPEPQTGAEAEPAASPSEQGHATSEPAAPPETVSVPTPARNLSDQAASILHEEAERERRARVAEDTVMETQTELGIDKAPPPPAPAPTPPPAATIDNVADAVRSAEITPRPRATDRTANSRDLLPDIEEINSTLTATSSRRDAERAILTEVDDPPKSRIGFQVGFIGAIAVAVAAVAVYVYAPLIADRVPAARPVLFSYVSQVDTLRLWLDGWVTGTIQSLTDVMSSAASDG